jgi:hypothetical protein
MSYEKAPRFQGLFTFIDANLEGPRRYELIAFPDDDLQFVQGNGPDVL